MSDFQALVVLRLRLMLEMNFQSPCFCRYFALLLLSWPMLLVRFLYPHFPNLNIFLVIGGQMLIKMDPNMMRVWRNRCLFAFFFIINALYFPLASNIFSAFACTKDPVTHKYALCFMLLDFDIDLFRIRSYLNSRPYIECSVHNELYQGIFVLAIVFLIPYVV